ncbi:MAG: glycoside hydrolase family 3 C-terminal domain-containing protein [Ignavibacteria bacterium]
MNQISLKYLLRTAAIFISLNSAILAQSLNINAGADQFVDFSKTHTVKLNGSRSSVDIKIKWSCPQNQQVIFKDDSDPETEVTFPRQGYYLLLVSSAAQNLADTVILNVFEPKSYEPRLNDLVGLMTIEEKISQLSNEAAGIPRIGLAGYNYWSEALHGILDEGVTSFPQAVALGSTWDPDLVFRVADAISDEARVKNKTEGKALTYWSPTINIARDPRWGRNEESYSEDPCLLSQMGVAFIKGMQGRDTFYLKAVSTPKHFIANNEESRRHNGSSDVDMRSLWEYFMPAFKNAITVGKAYSIMGAYNELNQVPCCTNSYLLTDVLRRKWGFEGYVVSDCGAINDMVSGHHFYSTGPEASARSVLAGCDLNCGEYYRLYLKDALDQDLIEEKDIDKAVKRVLSARFRLGEFDPTELVPYSSIPKEKLDSKEHRDLALEAAQKAIVLLKNDGILPIDKNEIKSIAVIGPNADPIELGIYSGWPNVQVSPLEGIKTKALSHGIQVDYSKGCDIGGGLLSPIGLKYFSEIEGTAKTGMKGEYFDNMNLSGTPVLTRVDSMIDFSFNAASPGPGVPNDKFSIRWKGKIKPPEIINILGTRTDDGARLYLDKKLIIEDWTEHGEKPNSAAVHLEPGKEYEIVFEHFDNSLGAAARLTWDLGQKDFDQAKKIAEGKDLVVLMLGTSPGISQEELDRNEIELPEVQRELVKQISEVNKNIVIVLINGGPVALAGTEKYAKAIVEAWYTGQSTGTALADVLFGDVNPGGKLPETFYASTDQLPPFSDYDIINNGRTYMYFEKPVLFPFGHGLSYTKFAYSSLKLNANKIKKDGEIEIEFTIKNAGSYKGDEVVQVYAKDLKASVKVPIHKLVRFKRITLKPNESQTLKFILPASELSFYDNKTNDFIVEPGEFEIRVGSSSKDIRLKDTFIVE